MRKGLLLLVSLLAVSPAFAAGSADLEVTSVTTDAQSVVTGGRMAVTIRIINRGPDNAGPVNLNLTTSYPQEILVVSYTAPPGWTCSPRLTAGRRYLGLANHLAIFPGAAIMLAVMGLNFLGDGLIDALDPKYRKLMR